MEARLGTSTLLPANDEQQVVRSKRVELREHAQLVGRRDERERKANDEESTDFGAECELLVAWPCERKVLRRGEHWNLGFWTATSWTDVVAVVASRPGDGRGTEGANTLTGSRAGEDGEGHWRRCWGSGCWC